MSKARELAENREVPQPPYPYFWRTQVQRAKEKAHRLMRELRRQAAKSSSWKQKFKSTRGTVPVMAKRIADLERRLAEAHSVHCDCCEVGICGDAPCGYPGHPNFIDSRCAAIRGGR